MADYKMQPDRAFGFNLFPDGADLVMEVDPASPALAAYEKAILPRIALTIWPQAMTEDMSTKEGFFDVYIDYADDTASSHVSLIDAIREGLSESIIDDSEDVERNIDAIQRLIAELQDLLPEQGKRLMALRAKEAAK